MKRIKKECKCEWSKDKDHKGQDSRYCVGCIKAGCTHCSPKPTKIEHLPIYVRDTRPSIDQYNQVAKKINQIIDLLSH